MTVAELISRLQHLPGDMRVVVDGKEYDVDDVDDVRVVRVQVDANTEEWWHGRHSIASSGDGVPVVLIARE